MESLILTDGSLADSQSAYIHIKEITAGEIVGGAYPRYRYSQADGISLRDTVMVTWVDRSIPETGDWVSEVKGNRDHRKFPAPQYVFIDHVARLAVPLVILKTIVVA